MYIMKQTEVAQQSSSSMCRYLTSHVLFIRVVQVPLEVRAMLSDTVDYTSPISLNLFLRHHSCSIKQHSTVKKWRGGGGGRGWKGHVM